MEYLPFGETLVEEHLNSNNSPFKFNAKEFDAETGWYYYGARYYDPKWSIFISLDPYDRGFFGGYGLNGLGQANSFTPVRSLSQNQSFIMKRLIEFSAVSLGAGVATDRYFRHINNN